MAKRQTVKVGNVRTSKSSAVTATAGKASAPPINVTISHRQIAERAYNIWLRKGRPHGQDLQNWREAEAELATQRG